MRHQNGAPSHRHAQWNWSKYANRNLALWRSCRSLLPDFTSTGGLFVDLNDAQPFKGSLILNL